MVWAREGVSERQWRSAANRPSRQARRGVGSTQLLSPAGETVGPRKTPLGAREQGSARLPCSGELRGRKGRKNQGGTGQVFLPARLTAMLCHRKAEGSGVKGRYPFRPRGVTPDREECPLGQRFPIPPGHARPLKSRSALQRRDFPALRGHAPRSALCGGIFPPRAGTRPGPSGQGLCLRGSSLSWG